MNWPFFYFTGFERKKQEKGMTTSHSYYPVALDLQGKRTLVVGGGTLATEKVEGLLVAGAQITVVSPTVTPTIAYLAESGELTLRQRPYASDDLDGIYLAYGATEDRAENARVAADARRLGVIVNAVDDIPNCDFFAVSIVRRGDLQIAISTNGRSPAFARWVREYLDAWLPKAFGGVLDALADVRQDLRAQGTTPPYERWRAAIGEEVFSQLPRGVTQGARERVYDSVTASPHPERPTGPVSLPWKGA
jgi:precorrin-2 dehydrogenase/sirohydrochlorin ferrochelatase